MNSRNKPEKLEALQIVPVLQPPRAVGQLGLFPRRTLTEFRPTRSTADCVAEAEVDDGLFYYLKIDKPRKAVRASEWLSTQLAEDVNIAAPPKALVQMFDGTVVFGSRRIANVASEVTTTRYLLQSTLKEGEVSGLARILSSIYVFDLFMNNDDRHLGNYLTVEDGDVRRLYAFDYSRSAFWDWPWNGYPGPGSNTRNSARLLRRCHGFDMQAADGVLERLSHISTEKILSVLSEMPADWLDAAMRQSFLVMWDGQGRSDRLETIRKGVVDGWLL